MNNNLIESIADNMVGIETIEKVAFERQKRINAFGDYYKKDEYVRNTDNRELDRAEARLQRAKLREKIKNTGNEREAEKLKFGLKRDKSLRNDMILSQVSDDFNPLTRIKQVYHGLSATAKTPHNIILPVATSAVGAPGINTPGILFDTRAARSLRTRDVILEREKGHKKHAEEYDELVEKIAYEREKRINAYKNYFQGDEYKRETMNRNFDRAESRKERADLKQKIRYAETKGEQEKYKEKLKSLKVRRNDMVVAQVGDTLNPLLRAKQLGHFVSATAKTPHNLLIPTPGGYHDYHTARKLVTRDMVVDRNKHSRKHASEREYLVEKVACDIINSVTG